jgi:hypothetical protein
MMNNNPHMKYYTDSNKKYNPTLSVGDWIEFEHDGLMVKGIINVVGKFGYWINSCSMYNGNIRCPFGNETKIEI